MQSIAIENNLSETAYVKKIDTHNYEIRWFSPLTEIDFCCHATLASAFVIFAKNDSVTTINFYAEAVGNLFVTKMDNGYIQMEFPSRPPESITDIPLNEAEFMEKIKAIKNLSILKQPTCI